MRTVAATTLLGLLLVGCRPGATSSPPATRPTAPAATAGGTLELPRVIGSGSGEAIIAWEGGVPVGHRSHLCVLRIAGRSARCTIPATVASDIDGGFSVVGVSASLRYVALQLADQLRIYETGALRVVASVAVDGGHIGHVDFDPGETRAVWMQADGPRIVALASGAVAVLPAVGTDRRVRWITDAKLLAWGGAQPPMLVGSDGSHEVVALPATAWAGADVDVHGERVSIATSSGMVAVFAPLREEQVQVLRAPEGGDRFVLHSVHFDPAGRRVLTVRDGERTTEIGIFDTGGEPARLLSTPGRPMFASFSGDGAQVAWSNEDIVGDMAGGDLFPGFMTRVDVRGDPAHSLADTFLGWSGTRMLVLAARGACLRIRHHAIFCREQRWAPYPETHRAGDVLWVGGDRILRAGGGEDRVSELYVTGTVDRPVLNVIEHRVDTRDPWPEAVQGGVSERVQVSTDGP